MQQGKRLALIVGLGAAAHDKAAVLAKAAGLAVLPVGIKLTRTVDSHRLMQQCLPQPAQNSPISSSLRSSSIRVATTLS